MVMSFVVHVVVRCEVNILLLAAAAKQAKLRGAEAAAEGAWAAATTAVGDATTQAGAEAAAEGAWAAAATAGRLNTSGGRGGNGSFGGGGDTSKAVGAEGAWAAATTAAGDATTQAGVEAATSSWVAVVKQAKLRDLRRS